jgi:integrase
MAQAGRIDHVRDGRRILFERAKIRERIECGRVLSPFELLQQRPLICLAEFDKLHLRGGKKHAVSKETRRWRYGIGTIYLRETKQGKGRWCMDYKDGQGKRRREVTSAVQNRGEALVALQAKVSEIFSGKFSPPRKSEFGTFKELSDLYMKNYAQKEKKSWRTDEFRLRKIKESLGDIKLTEITDSTIRDYRQQRLDEGISPLTANREMALLKKMFSYAAEKGMIGENPARKVKMFSEADTARDRVLSRDEEQRLFSGLAPHMKPIVLVGLHAGLRLGEVLGLKWSDINLEKRTVKAEHTKGKRARFVPLNSVLCAEFERLRTAKLDAKIIFPFKRRSVRTGFENALKAAKIEDFTFHDLRRTFGTRLLESGVDIVTIQKLYGHSNVLTTQHYLHPADVLSEEAVELLASHEQKKPENLSQICHTGRKSAVSLSLSRSFSVN